MVGEAANGCCDVVPRVIQGCYKMVGKFEDKGRVRKYAHATTRYGAGEKDKRRQKKWQRGERY
jgi:hypothetical protein